MSIYDKLFEDDDVVKKIKTKLPHLFQLAELESTRDGKVGMEIGSVRERILIALLIYKFGEESVKVDKITSPEIDVYVNKIPLSIKTLTTPKSGWTAIKLIWTVDAQKALQFKDTYKPSCDMLIAKIQWGGKGKLLLFTKESQNKVLKSLGKDEYIKLPKQNTNARGVEITKKALTLLEKCDDTKSIEIEFIKEELNYKEVYKKWIDLWNNSTI